MYIERNESGEIIAVYSSPQPGRAEELLNADSKEIADFYKRLMEIRTL